MRDLQFGGRGILNSDFVGGGESAKSSGFFYFLHITVHAAHVARDCMPSRETFFANCVLDRVFVKKSAKLSADGTSSRPIDLSLFSPHSTVRSLLETWLSLLSIARNKSGERVVRDF